MLTADQLADGMLAAHATLADGLWHAPAGAIAPDRYRLVAAALGDRDVSRSELIQALVGAGYIRYSAVGRTITTHPLITRVGPARHRLQRLRQASGGPGETVHLFKEVRRSRSWRPARALPCCPRSRCTTSGWKESTNWTSPA